MESDGKTTALHARVLAHEDVRVFSWKEMPEYEHPERVLMLFPGPVSNTNNIKRQQQKKLTGNIYRTQRN